MTQRLRLVALLGALAAGCVTTPPTIGGEPPTLKDEAAERAYRELLARYTGRAEIYEGFDTRLFASATFQSPAFREARVRRRAAFQHIPAPQVEAELAEERAEAAREHVVFLGVHASDPWHDDFDRANSIWRLALLTPTGEVLPTRVKRLGRTSLDLRALYPYLGTFWVAYSVSFPTTFPNGTPVIPPDADAVVLRVASTLGSADLRMGAP